MTIISNLTRRDVLFFDVDLYRFNQLDLKRQTLSTTLTAKRILDNAQLIFSLLIAIENNMYSFLLTVSENLQILESLIHNFERKK